MKNLAVWVPAFAGTTLREVALAPINRSSCAGLTRVSITLRKAFLLDGLPGHLARRRASRFCPAMTTVRTTASARLQHVAAVVFLCRAGVQRIEFGEACDVGFRHLDRIRQQQPLDDLRAGRRRQ